MVITIGGRRVIMGTGISVVRLAAIILVERGILMMRRIIVIRVGILVVREAIKLVMLTILIMRVEIVVVHGTIWATMRRIKAFGLFVKGIVVPMVGISMPATRKLFIVIRKGINRRARGGRGAGI